MTLREKLKLVKNNFDKAYIILPVQQTDYELLGMDMSVQFFHDRSLPVECSIKCKLQEQNERFHTLNIGK